MTVGGQGWPRAAFQLAPGLQPPAWPDPDRPQQFHLDVAVDDVDRAEQQVLALGAARLAGAGSGSGSMRTRPGTRSACSSMAEQQGDSPLDPDLNDGRRHNGDMAEVDERAEMPEADDPRAKWRLLPDRIPPERWVTEKADPAVPGSVQSAEEQRSARAAWDDIRWAAGGL